MKERPVLLLETSPGVCLFEKWYWSIKDRITRSVIFAKITRLSDPTFSGFKSGGSGVFELRIFVGPGYRVYFGLKGQQVVVLISGGDKNSQREGINEAKKLWKKYKDEAQRYKRKLSL